MNHFQIDNETDSKQSAIFETTTSLFCDACIRICFGSISYLTNTLSGKYAALTVEKIKNNKQKEIIKYKCIGEFEKQEFIHLDNNEQFENQTLVNSYSIISETEICQDLYVFLLFNISSHNFKHHYQNCYSMGGRMLTPLENFQFARLLSNMYNESNHESDAYGSILFWLHDKSATDIDKDKYCSCGKFLFNLNFKQFWFPCSLGLLTNFCITPKLVTFHFYGPLNWFDRSYFFLFSGANAMLHGEESQIIKQSNGNWIIKGITHSEGAILVNESIPMGRKNWTFENENYLMTLTSCKKSEFACTNGLCLPETARCNSTAECEDSSDEENCEFLLTKQGYLKDAPPPPAINETYLTMTVNTTIYDMTDISSNDGIIVLDIAIYYMWKDIMLGYYNPLSIRTINCDDIWRPKLAMSDDPKYGFQTEFESYTSMCFFNKQKLIADKSKIEKLNTDSFMGNYFIFF